MRPPLPPSPYRISCWLTNGILKPALTRLDGGSPKSWMVCGKFSVPDITPLYIPACFESADNVLISAFWDGKQFFSRLGNPFTPPTWFLESALILR